MRVLVPRPAGSGADLLEALQRSGATGLHVPLIEILPEAASPEMSRAVTALAAGEFDWVAFTSAAAVTAVCAAARLRRVGRLVPHGTRVAAVGARTARELRRADLRVDLVPAGSGSAVELVAAWPSEAPGGRVLLPRSDLARPALPDALRAAGYHVEPVLAYRTVPRPMPDHIRRELAAGTIDAVLLTSPSTVRGATGSSIAADTMVIAIGRSTARAAAAAGIHVTAVAGRPDATGLLEALIDAARTRRDRARRTGAP